MTEINFEPLIAFFNSPSFDMIKLGLLAYIGLLWLAIIIWIARDSISRSSSLLFQTFSIFIGIFIPFLGILIYLIIRPGKTISELYYEELEHRLLSQTDKGNHHACQKCKTSLAQDFLFCPHCGDKQEKVKKTPSKKGRKKTESSD